MYTSENVLNEEFFYGEDGNLYKRITKEVFYPRRTYLRGKISGKYRGSWYEPLQEQYNATFYEFEIYEATVTVESITDFRKNAAFNYREDFIHLSEEHDSDTIEFPKEKLPQILPVLLKSNEKSFGINILEPKVYEFQPIRKMHQTEGDEIFGCFNGLISGFILDHQNEIIEEVSGPYIDDLPPDSFPPQIVEECVSSGISTGKVEKKQNYLRREYYCKNHDHRLWGDWEKTYNGSKDTSTLSTGIGCIGALITIIFILTVLPNMAILLPFILIPLLIGIIRPLLVWIWRIAALVMTILFCFSIYKAFTVKKTATYIPQTEIVESPKEKQKDEIKVVDPVTKNVRDTIYKQFRSWNDYDGNLYEGYYKFKKSSLYKSSAYKRNFNLRGNTERDYDYMLHVLKEVDKAELSGLYKMFDSIKNYGKLNHIKFAETIVSFVQDIPYALVLPDGCSPGLYNDNFIRTYLSKPNALCDGYQKFGINTPVEFIAKLKGDCDTRTLLLYTILSHYNYDVVILSSEYYQHSILGINIPYSGKSYHIDGARYVCWETTAGGAKPGVLPLEISNMNYWRISLKSK